MGIELTKYIARYKVEVYSNGKKIKTIQANEYVFEDNVLSINDNQRKKIKIYNPCEVIITEI